MSGRSRALTGLIGLLMVAALALAVAGSASAKTVWLCKPGAKPDPCKGSLKTTVTDSDGTTHVETPKNARDPKIDCFYVYPTVSEQKTTNADKHVDPQQTSIAQYQAARYSERCRVFAPVYRQLTLSAISTTEGLPANATRIAYGDVLEAWRTYLRKFNHGRGVVLIGHSQGAGMLTKLLSSEIERHRAQRDLLVSALLMGGNVTVPKGDDVGGSFSTTPVCHSEDEIGCVVAFSTFGETPPDNTIFGSPNGALVDTHGVDPSKLKVVCTNPAAIGGGAGKLQTLARSEPFPGTLGIGLNILYGGPQPTADTPWLEPQDHYSGRCVRENGANVLMLDPLDGARTLHPSPDATWGLHLVDANIGLGNLIELVKSQEEAYIAASDG
jgi:hypothetical protein